MAGVTLNRRGFLAAGVTSALARGGRALSTPCTRGLWRDAQGSVAIGNFPEFGEGPFVFDYGAMTCVRLVEHGSTWRVSTSLGGADVSEVEARWEGSNLRVGTRVLTSVETDRVAFSARHGDVELSAEIARPSRGTPKGTILLLYGSGPARKDALDLWAFWFLAQGYAVIAYDKRGCGQSSGDWRVSGLEMLAEDARMVVAAARTKFPSVRAPLLGWGISQGGWLLPQLAAIGAIDGAIVHAGAATTPAEQIQSAVEAELRGYEFTDDEIKKALAFYALDTDVSRGLRPFEDAEAAYRQAVAAGAEWIIGPLAARDAPERTMIRLMAPFDPRPYWRRSEKPALVLLGGKDRVVPAALNRRLFESVMSERAGLRLVVFPEANHLMFLAKTGVRTEYPSLSRFDPGYFPAIASFLRSVR